MARRFMDATAAVRKQTGALPQRERDFRNNFILYIINGACGGFGDALTSTPLVMTAFLSQVTTSNTLIALLGPLRDAGWYLPQFFLATWVDRQHSMLGAYRTSIAFRIAAWVAMVLAIFFIQDRTLLVIAVLGATLAISFLAGFAGLPFLLLTAKVIPAGRRGLVFGLRQFIGGVLGVAAGGLVALILSGHLGFGYPQNFAVVIGGGSAGYAASYLVLLLIKEPMDEAPATAHAGRNHPKLNLRQAWSIARGDAQYLRYIVMRIALLVGATCVPFLTVYAKRTLAVNDGFIGTLISVTLACGLLSNVVWARVSDHYGNRLVMMIAAAMGLAFCVIAIFITRLTPDASNGDIAHLALIGLFGLSGAMQTGIQLASLPLMIEVAPASQQALYIGLSNTVMGVVILLTSSAGIIVDQLGYLGIFILSALAFAIALERSVRMREPRIVALREDAS